MIRADGINTVRINNEVKHLSELDILTLCSEWSKLKNEINERYQINQTANSGWRGLLLRLIGVYLPDKQPGHLGLRCDGPKPVDDVVASASRFSPAGTGLSVLCLNRKLKQLCLQSRY